MANNTAKYVVVGGWIDDKRYPRMIQCLGAFKTAEEAYGKAYLYLDELVCSGNTNEEYLITSAVELEAETGFALYAKDGNGQERYYTYVLFNDTESEVQT